MEHADWIHRLVRYKAQNPLPMPEKPGCLNPRDILLPLAGLAGPDAVIVTDVGQHQMITAQYYPFSRPRSLASSGGLGTMGYGLGAAIGAKVAFPDLPDPGLRRREFPHDPHELATRCTSTSPSSS
jgi:acetolactate synthase-1/2/3 large subunit